MQSIAVSIVIPTFNRDDALIRVLQGLFEQSYANCKIIVIDQSNQFSEKKKDFIQKNADRMKYFHVSKRGRAYAKNFGIERAEGDVILFLDDDIVPFPDLVKVHVAAYSDPDVGGVAGGIIEEGEEPAAVLPIGRISIFGRPITNFNSTISTFITAARGGNLSFRKSVIDQVGFFDENMIGTEMMEEADLSARVTRAGHKILFEPKARVFHMPQSNGNLAQKDTDRIEWYYAYFHNLMLFFLKNMKRVYIPFMAGTCFLISMKQVIFYTHKISDISLLMSALRHGARTFNKTYCPVKKSVAS